MRKQKLLAGKMRIVHDGGKFGLYLEKDEVMELWVPDKRDKLKKVHSESGKPDVVKTATFLKTAFERLNLLEGI